MSKYLHMIADGSMGLIGGIASYIFTFTKVRRIAAREIKFPWVGLWMHSIISLVIGLTVGSFLPTDVAYRDGLLLLAGIGGVRIMEGIMAVSLPDLLEALWGLRLNSLEDQGKPATKEKDGN